MVMRDYGWEEFPFVEEESFFIGNPCRCRFFKSDF